MAGVVGRAFKIKKNQAKGYGYVKPNKYRRNPGVTTIAAINGRGSYRSARASMRGLSKNGRMGRARVQLSNAEKRAFADRMSQARHAKNIGRMGRKRKRIVRNARPAPRAARAASPLRRNRRTSPGVHAANRRKTSTMKRNKRRTAAPAATKRRRRRKTSKRRRKTSASKSPVTRRKRKAGKRKAKKGRRKLRKNKGTSAGAKKGWATRRRRKKATKRRAAPKRRRGRRKARASSKRRKTSKKKLKANRRRTRRNGRTLKANRRRTRRNPRRRTRRNKATMSSNRRRTRRNGRALKKNKRRRKMRRNRGMFRRNTGVMGALKTGAVLFGGFGIHRLLTNLFDSQVMARLLPAPAPVEAPSGLGQISQHSKTISAVLIAGIGSFAVSKVVKDENTKKLLIGGMVLSAFHSVVMGVLNAFAPSAANMLAGPEDGTAARISAMYGLGQGASIMPHYAQITGTGEYFTDPMSGVGEYFTNPTNGLGEYLAVQGMQGVGTYERNPNLLEAAAGMGQYREVSGNHIDPSSDLDRQLTIAEAAAGVGALTPFEAAAGLQPFEASAGMGAIDTVPSANTWIPGTSNPQLWAGVRPVDRGQAATEMVPAGILQTDGGQGIFG